jgi:hypothetical protein
MCTTLVIVGLLVAAVPLSESHDGDAAAEPIENVT